MIQQNDVTLKKIIEDFKDKLNEVEENKKEKKA